MALKLQAKRPLAMFSNNRQTFLTNICQPLGRNMAWKTMALDSPTFGKRTVARKPLLGNNVLYFSNQEIWLGFACLWETIWLGNINVLSIMEKTWLENSIFCSLPGDLFQISRKSQPGDLTVSKRTGTSNRIEIQFRTFNPLSRPDSFVKLFETLCLCLAQGNGCLGQI